MAPSPTGTASCMNWPRRRTVRTASGKLKVPAMTWAEYSPREWPATKLGGDAGLMQHARGGHGNGEDGRLGDFGKAEFFLRPFKAQLAERVSERFVGFFKDAAGGGMIMSEVLPHAGGLRALAGEEECESGNTLCHDGSVQKVIRRLYSAAA
jgi:hypothetical protein